MKKRESLKKLSLEKIKISNLASKTIIGGTGNPSLHSCVGQGNQPGQTCYTNNCGGTGGGTGGGGISGPIYC
ncbi:hypothetical protein ATE84_1510 [Aquimarina sp. MAR_2010_214]|uniref:hypothetical protein n=1 Tax=Aquimarina sp. MAR_2010_214 TaxID=1250026 RepID=UPI000C707975|nr:hypothetical protein [Aquimarina sp. MAR_2010_214]PKV49484.1 hypothetical protein ATE84_1510 [Aquimarina sp. MAR_2010_214]